jgi:hypothetical protein
VAVEHFDYGALDDVDGLLLEALAEKGTARELLEELVEEEVRSRRADLVAAVMVEITQSAEPLKALYQIAFACGSMATGGLTESEVAARFGISKQAMQQGVRRFEESLNLRKARFMRSEGSRRLMRSRNFRRGEK